MWIFGHFEHLKVFLLCMRKINDFRGSCTEKNQLGAHRCKFKILTFTKDVSRALAVWPRKAIFWLTVSRFKSLPSTKMTQWVHNGKYFYCAPLREHYWHNCLMSSRIFFSSIKFHSKFLQRTGPWRLKVFLPLEGRAAALNDASSFVR